MKFSIRDLFWLTTLAAVCTGWYLNRSDLPGREVLLEKLKYQERVSEYWRDSQEDYEKRNRELQTWIHANTPKLRS